MVFTVPPGSGYALRILHADPDPEGLPEGGFMRIRFFHEEYIFLKAMVENDINDNSTANLSIKKFNDWESKQPEITYTEPVSNRK